LHATRTHAFLLETYMAVVHHAWLLVVASAAQYHVSFTLRQPPNVLHRYCAGLGVSTESYCASPLVAVGGQCARTRMCANSTATVCGSVTSMPAAVGAALTVVGCPPRGFLVHG
jgi:hypothetical protein